LPALPVVRGQENVEAVIRGKYSTDSALRTGKEAALPSQSGMNGETRFLQLLRALRIMTRGTNESPQIRSSISARREIVCDDDALQKAVKRGELSLDDPVAKYVTELQRGGDIRRINSGRALRVTLLDCQTTRGNTSGEASRQYTWPDFVRFP